MFAATFLGHQGWLFRSGESCVLVDPLLHEEFGQAYALEYRVHPPRAWQFDALPPVDAVLLTHEHDDHFDIPSLARLDRQIPIYLSARSSSAAYAILAEMGFSVQPLVPGLGLSLGQLEVYPLVGDHVRRDNGDEWDALPFAIRDVERDGSFFSAVDVSLTPELLERAHAWCESPGLVGWTNNTLDLSHMTNFLPDVGDTSQLFAEQMLAGTRLVAEHWGDARAWLLCGGGFAFHGPRTGLNRRLFCVDPESVVRHLAASVPGARAFATLPGQTFRMKHNLLESVDDSEAFLAAAPVSSWPSRQREHATAMPDYAPATGRVELAASEVAALHGKLQELADALPGSQLFRGLYSLLGVELTGYQCSFALVLRHAERAAVFEYRPNACAFGPAGAGLPRDTYIAGMECWASDLLAVLSGELSPITLSMGRARLWNHVADRFDFNPFRELYRVSHPLRRPSAYLKLYQKILRTCEPGAPSIRAHQNR